MSRPFRLYRRSNGRYYLEDVLTRKQSSLHTDSKSVALRKLAAKNEAAEQPYLNVSIAKTYLSVKSPEMLSRTWGELMDDMAVGYRGSTRLRWAKVIASKPFRVIAPLRLLNTDSSHFSPVPIEYQGKITRDANHRRSRWGELFHDALRSYPRGSDSAKF